MPGKALLFSYRLSDAWDMPIASMALYDGDNPFVRFSYNDGDNPSFLSAENAINLDSSVIEAIKKYLKNVSITRIEPLTHIIVMDGYNQEFSYNNGEALINLKSKNISRCREKPHLYPNAIAMIKAQKSIAKILIPKGVLSKCFDLGK